MIKFRSRKKYYLYDLGTDTVYTSSDNPKEIDDVDLRIAAQAVVGNIRAEGYHPGMNYQTFDNYIAVLTGSEKNDLFHFVYEAYLYVNDWVNDTKRSTTEYHKGMAKVKRWEQYLYKILKS